MISSCKSQLEYGRFGGNICTPVCCVVASKYILDDKNPENISELFTCANMDKIMRTCHELYADCFSHKGVNMMLYDVQKYFPKTVSFRDIAGMTHSQNGELKVSEDESLLIQSLVDLLHNNNNYKFGKNGAKAAFIITCQDHTTCYLLNGKGGMYFFDPLPAHFIDVTHTWRKTISDRDSEYSGIILTSSSALPPLPPSQ